MNKKEKELAAKMLDLASDEFGNHTCNDLPNSVWKGWTKEERQKFVKAFHKWNGDPEEYDPNFLHMSDSSVMSFLAAKLKGEA
jgi:hypothetical protein